ncbi:MAG: hypothetical protein HKO87_02005 [Acidimicrobiia bacterium]|nr:hypothetical protein [Acidimicrobiia bacterium]
MKTRRAALGFFILALAGAACGAPVSMGDAARAPEPPPPVIGFVTLASDDGSAIKADITFESVTFPTDASGAAEAIWPEEPAEVKISATGFLDYSTTIAQLPETGVFEAVLTPRRLSGTVVGPGGVPLPRTTVIQGGAEVVTDDSGEFLLTRVEPGVIEASRPAWEPASLAWDGTSDAVTVEMEPRLIRALRVQGAKAGNPSQWRDLLDLAEQSGVNAFVLDTKNEGGTVFHDTEVRLAHEISAVQAFYDLDQVIADMDAAGLYKITRIVTFQDDPLARARPEIAAMDSETGEQWRNYKGLRWLDPTDRESWEYSLALAEEACRRGFDEIQFDYIRFPSDGPIRTLVFDEPYTQEVREATIAAFMEAAYDLLNPMGCAVAADIFAITLESSTDEGIGQRPQQMSYYADVLSPMIYTYTYGPGWKGFDNPNEHPVEIVSTALDNGAPKLEGHSIYRPWIQTWLLEAEEIVAVQQVAEERDLGWMIWSANTLYSMNFLPDPE